MPPPSRSRSCRRPPAGAAGRGNLQQPFLLAGRRRWLAAGAAAAAALLPGLRLPGPLIGLGPEPEPAPLIRQWLGWNLRGAWRDPRGGDYLAALGEVRTPVLAVAGEGDLLLAPPLAVDDLLGRFGPGDRTLIRVGTRTGYRENYDHAGLVIGRGAREEIWPRVIDWLTARSTRESETRERA